MFEYDVNAKAAAEELDKHDLTNTLILCWKIGAEDPYAIKQEIQNEAVPNSIALFDAVEELSPDELMEYLTQKYDVRFEEVVSYRMLRPRFMKG